MSVRAAQFPPTVVSQRTVHSRAAIRPTATAHQRFTRSVQHRWTAARATEITAVAVAWVAIAAAVAPRAALPLTIAAILIATVRILRTLPTLAAAAARIDRQFGWDELLSTAVATSSDPDPFAAAVRATADVRCAAVSPSAVPIAGMGRRGWSAILVSVVAASIVPLMGNRSGAIETPAAATPDAAVLIADADRAAPMIQPPAAAAPLPRRTGSDTLDQRGSSPGTDDASQAAKPSDDGKHIEARSPRAGTGRGSASTPQAPTIDHLATASSTPRVDTGSQAASGGASARSLPTGPDGPTGLATTATPSDAVAPWQSSAWPAARRSAAAAIAAGTVPAADRDLVRDYFDRAADAR